MWTYTKVFRDSHSWIYQEKTVAKIWGFMRCASKTRCSKSDSPTAKVRCFFRSDSSIAQGNSIEFNSTLVCGTPACTSLPVTRQLGKFLFPGRGPAILCQMTPASHSSRISHAFCNLPLRAVQVKFMATSVGFNNGRLVEGPPVDGPAPSEFIGAFIRRLSPFLRGFLAT